MVCFTSMIWEDAGEELELAPGSYMHQLMSAGLGCCVMARGGLYAPWAWCRHTMAWVQCRAEKRPVWHMCEVNSGRKLSNGGEESLVHI